MATVLATSTTQSVSKRAEKKKVKTVENHKFNNIDAEAFAALVKHNSEIGFKYAGDHILNSLHALNTKGIWGYLKNMIPEKMRSRVMFGFLRKRSKGHLKYFINRWWFLISSRPLNMEDFLEDDHVLQETELPPLYEFDTMYYYYMDTPFDASGAQGKIETNAIISVQIKNM